MQRHQSEVIIIGGGLAGIVCALQLLDAGRRVLLLDRDAPEHFGGLAKESFGGLLIVDTPLQRRQKLKDSPDLALQDWLAFGAFDAASAQPGHPFYWPRQWAEHYVGDSLQHLYHWLTARGVGFLPLPLWVERGMGPGASGAARGNSVPRWHVVWGTGQGLVGALLRQLERHPQRDHLTLKFGHRVEGLLTTGGAVTGCHGHTEGDAPEAFEAHAPQVVIAAGGINGGDLGLVRQHWHADWGQVPESLLNGSHQFADGTLHRAAQGVGGQVTHLQNQWNYAAGIAHWRPRKPRHGLSLVPPKSALWLNARGERITPALVSGFDTRDLVTQVCAQPSGYSWQLMNRRIALKELAISGAEFNPSIRDKGKLGFVRDLLLGNRWLLNEVLTHSTDVVTARTLNELADKMNALQGDSAVRADTLRGAVEHYDAEVAKGTASQDPQRLAIAQLRQWKGDRLRTCKAARIDDGSGLIAIREHIISRKSLGGIQTNLNSQVLASSGQPIAGLYAIGEAAGFGGGGMNGLRGLEGTFLGGCIYSAQRAALAIR
ncbi:FAD-binding dehydrogenase [Ottowia testudinis]|uniref:FAD-binding dehydrogenase n=1 Tax=Ottowia testudinis TaxID=2816950 RepID=A0A975H1M5_9BURK|nr:FAD-binding dehydrogenase [Ottowia testudinis]QTD43983.1 FAD-binding dehydrogenase [Ottowia testudinis]